MTLVQLIYGTVNVYTQIHMQQPLHAHAHALSGGSALCVRTDMQACVYTFRNRGKKRGVRSTLPKACAEQIP